MSGDSPVSKGFDFIEQDPVRDEIRVRFGAGEIFHYYLDKIIEDQFKLNIHDKKITYSDLGEVVKGIMFDMKRAQIEGDLSGGPVAEFDKRKGEALSEFLSNGLRDYTLTFPLNLGLIQPDIDEISVLEGCFQPVDQDRWVKDYFGVAKAEDERFFTEFLEISPNNFLDRTFAYFKIDYQARSEGYALSRVQDLANLAIGELNLCIHQNSRAPPKPSSDTALPYETWAALKEPGFYLVFEDDEYLFPRPMDYGYRRYVKSSRQRKDDVADFYSLPELSEDDPVDTDLINAILAYQDGLTEPSKRKAFFSFWRGLENLSQIDSPKGEVKDRGRFALEHMRGRDTVLPTHERAHEQIDDVRNSLAHEGVHIHVGNEHRDYAKILLDGMIELYLQKREEFNREDFDTFLKYGIEYQRSAGKIISILQQSGFGQS